jgi:hypothetical protein
LQLWKYTKLKSVFCLILDKGSDSLTTMTCLTTCNKQLETKWSFRYRFIKDEFINTVLIEFLLGPGLIKIKHLILNKELFTELLYDELPSTKYNQYLYRIKPIHLLNVSLFVVLSSVNWKASKQKVNHAYLNLNSSSVFVLLIF